MPTAAENVKAMMMDQAETLVGETVTNMESRPDPLLIIS